MTFTNATMLAGIAGAMVPLTLHLLGRARYKGVQWGAMIFLSGPTMRQSRASRLKELSLLGLRMAMVAVLAVALSRPIVAPGSTTALDEPTSMLIIVDRSPSMTFGENGPLRKDVASRAALASLATLRPGDEAAVLFTPQTPSPGSVDFTSELQAIASRLGDIPPGLERANLAATLNAAAAMFRNSHAMNRRIVLITDHQATNWNEVDSAFAASWKKLASDTSGRQPLFTVIPVGSTDAGNVAIESVQAVSLPVIRDAASAVEVRVRNFDTVPVVGVSLSVQVDNAEVHKTTLNLAAGAVATIRCAVRFKTAGPHTLLARLDPSGLPFDDSLEVGVDVLEPLSVLVLSGDLTDPRELGKQNGAWYAKAALSPFAAAAEAGIDPAQVELAGTSGWPEITRKRYQVLVLSNLPRLSPAQTRQIEQFVYGGGGVLIAPGHLSRVDDYNAGLWRDGAGLLPAELESPVAADGSQATTLQGLELSHPVFRFLRNGGEPLPRVAVDRYFPVRSPESRGTVLGRYASGKAFLIETAYGRGRVMLMTTPLDAEWSKLPFSNFYLPFVQSTIRYLASASLPERNLLPGQPIVVQLSGSVASRVSIGGPGFIERAIDPLPVGDGYEVRYFNTSRPGTYRVRALGDREIRFLPYFVLTPRDESDLAGLTSDQWRHFQQMLDFTVAAPEPQLITTELSDTQSRELWPWLLGVAMCIAIMEMALTRLWSDPAAEGAA